MYAQGLFPASFVGGRVGSWRVESQQTLAGAPLPSVDRIDVRRPQPHPDGTWVLRGVAGHARYVERREKTAFDPVSPPLGRREATRAALIPIRKTAAWWALPQDERRTIFEQHSQHISDALAYLPRVARRLYQARELGEPFDFLTWFEFAPEHAAAFDELVALLRSREEWAYVEREVDIRLSRES